MIWGSRDTTLRRKAVRICVAAVMVMAVAACKDRAREEARLFLDRVEQLDPEQSIPVRRSHVDALKALPLRENDVARTREECVAAHEAMLAAEEDHLSAKTALGDSDGEKLDEASIQKITATIARSEEGVKRARALFPKCERDVRSLSLRFRFVK